MNRSLEIISIGTELLLGDVVDTNAPRAGRLLTSLGISVSRHVTVPDVPEVIAAAVDEALERTGIVVTTGGLGPTRDDLTRDVVADLLGLELDFDDSVWQELLQRWQRAGRAIDESNRVQAMVPRGAEVLPNRWGTAPGLWIDTPRGLAILLPGVPIEFEGILGEEVLPRLERRLGSARIVSRVLRTSGVAEARLGGMLGPIESELAPVSLAYLPDQVGVDLRLTAWNVSAAEAEVLLNAAEARVRELTDDWIYATGAVDLAEVVLEQCRHHGVKLALAESCTGGMLGARFTAIAGSSDVLMGGVVSYANEVKRDLLDVPQSLLDQHGAVSSQVAESMAGGAAVRLGADLGISITGVAGPGGGSTDKPVGLVWIGWSFAGRTDSREYRFTGGRAQIRSRACQAALLAAREVLGT